ncbi:polymorphic toxin-type HINT domain-containing protein [Sinosporangium siamense]|uniref:polymorphic toxin-type HINT domain-containing protein n=1 Tax=Sinosporangium siamense TaxID=1367973 RepID=UPI0036D38929
MISGVGVPPGLTSAAASAASIAKSDEPSINGRPVPKKKYGKGAEETTPRPERREPVWPKAGKVQVALAQELAPAGDLPVQVAAAGSAGQVQIETLNAEAVRKLGAAGLAVRLSRADNATKAAKVKAGFSYADFKDAHGGDFAGRLQLVRLPECALTDPKARGCKTQGTVVKSVNDQKAGRLVAEVEAASGSTPAGGFVYALMAGPSGPSGNFTATDLKPSGTWQAGKSSGDFSYQYPLPEAPSAGGDGPDLALEYSASSLDGQGAWTNNQSGVVGAGWDLNAGFIERRFQRCSLQFAYDWEGNPFWDATEGGSRGAVCWESPDANDGDSSTNDLTQSELVLNVAGQSSQIVKDRTGGTWKTVPDLGWKVEEVAGGANGEAYWRVTTQSGQVYRFGSTADAQWRLPYVGNDAGEPCNNKFTTATVPPTCTAVWRWNLDREADSRENLIDYAYDREQNWFCLPSCTSEQARVLPYDRGGMLTTVQWGHNGQVAGSVPTARTSFSGVSRGTTDVPTDLSCAAATGCTNKDLAFFTTKKLGTVTAESRNPTTGNWDSVEQLSFSHEWIYTRTDFMSPYDPVMWLDKISRTGLAGTSITMPPVDFDAVMRAGRMHYDDMSDWTSLLSWRMVPRIGVIQNGLGGRTEVTYGQADPCSGGNGRDGSNYHADHTGDCYKVDQTNGSNVAWVVHYKQLATQVVERDMVGASPDMVTAYEYLGSPGWAAPVDYAGPGLAPPSSDWRGYQTVRTIEGSGTDPARYTVTSDTFYRGMGGTIVDFDGVSRTDSRELQGRPLQDQTWTMTAYSPRAYTEAESSRYEYSITTTGNGPGIHDPVRTVTTRERTRERKTGGTWRYTDQVMTYNADGLPATVNDKGEDGVASDNSCTSTTYARNTASGQWMTAFPSTVEERAGDSCTTGAVTGRTVTLYDGGSDPATNTPTDGNVTQTRFSVSPTVTTSTSGTYDGYGRPLTTTDERGNTTTITYSPAVGWPATGVTVTGPAPLNHKATTVASHLHGQTVKVTDANLKESEVDYDALGRTTALWTHANPRGGGTPAVTAAYDIPSGGWMAQPTGPTKTTVSRLQSGSGTGATWLTSHTYEDGLGRIRESQTASPQGGRIVTATTYDARGLVSAVTDPVHNGSAPGSGLLNPALTSVPQWSKLEYDGLERTVADIDYHQATELRRTTTAYPGAERVEVTPPTGAKTAGVQDAFGRTVKVEEWTGPTTHNDTVYVYDLDGNLTSSTDARGSVRTFTYDWLGRRTAATDPDAGTSSTGYDAAGNPVWTIDGRGQKVSTVYDVLDRQTSQWAGEVDTGTKLAEWTYDDVAKGHPVASISYNVGSAYTRAVTSYDDDYRPTGTTVTIPAAEGALAGTYSFTSGYNSAGDLTSQGMPAAGGLSAETLTHTYTDQGLVKAMTSNLGGTTTYLKNSTYSLTARLTEHLLGNAGQVKRNHAYETTTGLVSHITTTTKADTATPVTSQDDRYTYDIAGQITRILDAASAVPGTHDGQSECYTYDSRLRLATAFTTTANTCASGANTQGTDPYNQAYGYDAVGNITSLTDSGASANYAYPTGASAARPNAVTSITRPGGTDTYTYDNAGQLTARNVSGTAGTFTWDALGRLGQATIGGQSTAMVYDASGERLIRRAPGGKTTLYLGGMELELSGGTVSAKRYYTSADGTMLAMRDSGGLTWLLSGLHGSTQLAVNDTTGAVSRERYLPYGKRRGGDDLPFTDLGFLGKTEDDSPALTYLSARYYDPGIARFISTDPLLDLRVPQWANPYSYAGNNPVSHSDPTGLRVDTGNRKSDQTFSKTHHTSGKKKSKAYIRAEKKLAAQRAKAERDRRAREAARNRQIAKEAALDNREKYAKPSKPPPKKKSTVQKAADKCASNIVCDFVAGDALNCAAKPSLKSCGMAAASFIPGGKIATTALKAGSKITKAVKKADNVGGCRKSSFAPGTRVVLADGKAKEIEKIEVGDSVLASDPENGLTGTKEVIALVTSKGSKSLVVITVKGEDLVDGSTASNKLTATADHPFWVPSLREWLPASHLQKGMLLQTAAGTHVQVAAVESRSATLRVHNLTVDDLHTYYVTTGTASVLVHNTGNDPVPACDLIRPGPYAVESIPARSQSQRFTQKERDEINRIGNYFGCHSCGATNPGAGVRNWTPDHQPVSRFIVPGTPQRLYPHCRACSNRQGGIVGHMPANRGVPFLP